MRLAFAVLALAACNGPDNNFNALSPEIALSHDTLDFEQQPIFEPRTLDLFISNGGRAPDNVRLALAGDPAFSLGAETEMQVFAGESWQVPVIFEPTTFLDYTATLTVFSDDQDTPETIVQLIGEGIPAPVPDIELDTLVLDFGAVTAGSSNTRWVNIGNVGNAPLNLGTIEQGGSGAFSIPVLTDPSGGTVEDDTSLVLLLQYQPTHEDGDTGTITIPSNDPDEPSVEVLLLGNGGGDFEYPEAIIDCPNGAHPPEFVYLDGSGSTDPGGQELSYRWSLPRRPDGSQTNLSTFTGDATYFFADVAGEFEVQLVVTNELGVSSAPEKCVIQATPLDEVHVELTWDTSAADLDLHLMQQDASFFEKPGDCNFCNPNPNWNGGGQDNDPSLDIDDRSGFGPENINIQFPDNGSYLVKVHYFDENGDDQVEATVRIYTYGVLEQELTKILERNEVWDVGQINMPDGTVGVQSNALYQSVERFCY